MDTTSSSRVEIFYNAATGETVTRELTPEEIAALPEPAEPPTPVPE